MSEYKLAKYNENARYEIIGRIIDGVQVESYILRDRHNGCHIVMNKSEVNTNALAKNIYNCTGQLYNGKIIIKGINCKLNQLDKFDTSGNRLIKTKTRTMKNEKPTMRIIGKVLEGRNIVSYVLNYKDGDEVRTIVVDKETVVKLASNGKIINATTQRLGDKIILRGNQECDQLSKLPIYRM